MDNNDKSSPITESLSSCYSRT